MRRVLLALLILAWGYGYATLLAPALAAHWRRAEALEAERWQLAHPVFGPGITTDGGGDFPALRVRDGDRIDFSGGSGYLYCPMPEGCTIRTFKVRNGGD